MRFIDGHELRRAFDRRIDLEIVDLVLDDIREDRQRSENLCYRRCLDDPDYRLGVFGMLVDHRV